jgi:cytochrome c
MYRRSGHWSLVAAGAMLLFALLAVATACGIQPSSGTTLQVAGGDQARGKTALQQYGCGSCHQISGVSNARGDVGPPLTGLASRRVIAGYLPNTADNLIHWIQNPQSVAPGNVMPNMGVSDQDARDMAAYLATLK